MSAAGASFPAEPPEAMVRMERKKTLGIERRGRGEPLWRKATSLSVESAASRGRIFPRR